MGEDAARWASMGASGGDPDAFGSLRRNCALDFYVADAAVCYVLLETVLHLIFGSEIDDLPP